MVDLKYRCSHACLIQDSLLATACAAAFEIAVDHSDVDLDGRRCEWLTAPVFDLIDTAGEALVIELDLVQAAAQPAYLGVETAPFPLALLQEIQDGR